MAIDPTLHYCQCGCSWKPKLTHKLLMLIFGSYTRRCGQCGTVMKFRLIGHVVKVDTKKITGKEKLWRNS